MEISNVAEFRQRVEKEWERDETAAARQKYYAQMKEQLAPVGATLHARLSDGSPVPDARSRSDIAARRCRIHERRRS